MKTTSIRLDEKMEAHLKQAAREEGKPASEIIRTAIEEHLNRRMRLDVTLAAFIGILDGLPMNSAQSRQEFEEALEARYQRTQ